jgi:nucleoside-diphosphate-sugar epimerase
MSRPEPDAVRTVACVGAGVIGGGWVAYFLARGYRVVAWDPAEDAETRLHHLVQAAWPALTELGLAEGASVDNLTVERDLAAACAESDFVQESAPEDLELKRSLLADIDAATPEHVVISSSTSGYGMSQMQVRCEGEFRDVQPRALSYLRQDHLGGVRRPRRRGQGDDPRRAVVPRPRRGRAGRRVVRLTRCYPGWRTSTRLP